MKRLIPALVFALLLISVGAAAATTTVTYTVALPNTRGPATAPFAQAVVTYAVDASPAYLSTPQVPTYSAATGKLTWTLPQNSQAQITVRGTSLSATTFTFGTAASYDLNAMVPTATPATQPTWAGNYLLRDGTNTMTGDLTFEGATDNAYEGVIDPGDPTGDWSWAFPNKSGTIAMTSDIPAEVDPRLPAASTAGNLLTSNGSAWTSAAPTAYLPLTGGSLSGDLYRGDPLGAAAYSQYQPDAIWFFGAAPTTGSLSIRPPIFADAHIHTLRFPHVDGTVWTSGNDGAASGLDADTLDGSHAAAFALSAAGVPTPANPGDDNKLLKASGGAFSWQTVSLTESDTLASVTARGATTDTLITLDNGNTSAGRIAFLEDSSNGSNAVTLSGAQSTGDVTVTLPSTTGVLALTSDIPAEVDGVVGNEITNVSGTTLTRSGTGTGADPYLVALNMGNANTWTALQSTSLDGNNAALEVAQYANTNQATTGQVGDTAAISFDLMGTSDGGGTYAAAEAGRIEVYKVSDWFNASGTADNDSGFKFWVNTGGTFIARATLDNEGDFSIGRMLSASRILCLAGSAVSAANTAGMGTDGIFYEGTEADAGELRFAFAGFTTSDYDFTLAFPNPAGSDKTVTFPDVTGTVSVIGTANLTADDVTPDVSTATVWKSVANGGATVLTDLDSPVVGAFYTIICGSATNPISIADSAPFALAGAWNPDSVGDNIVLYVNADNDYYEVSRANN